MLHVNDITYRIAGRPLLEQATVALPANHKAGLVGPNGSGKTTLMRLILGELQLDDGSISLRPRARVATVAQEAPDGSMSLVDCVLATDTERADLLAESETATDPGRIADVHTRLSDIDAYTAPTRAASILSGLGFSEPAQQERLDSFSGGWRMRVALASTLFANPDILLLDEPTNHLDLEASIWLENHLKSWRGTILMISHDRTFLNAVATEIIHLEERKLVRYVGNYDQFEKTRRERQELNAKLRSRQVAERRHIQSFVDRFRYKASKARQAQSRLKMLERMEPVAAHMVDRTVKFDFPIPNPLSPPLVLLDEVEVGYEPGKPILRNLDMRIDMDDRIGLLGANGNGKSTLAKLFADRLKPDQGKLQKSPKLKVGYFAQHQIEDLVLGQTAFEHLRSMMDKEPEHKIRAHLGKFGLEGQRSDTEVSKLSGGEKARLIFSMISREAPHVLLLDEPTNHLDVDAREALVHALNAYEGAVMLISHDAHLLEATCDRLWLVDQGTCRDFDGDLRDYTKLLLEQRRMERKELSQKSSRPVQVLSKKEQRKHRAAQRAEASGLQQTVRAAEKEMETTSKELHAIESQLSNPAVYDGDEKELIKLQARHKALKAHMATAEEAWLAASSAVETEET
jgi:ATP-binding cassette, subfamily F, member 3